MWEKEKICVLSELCEGGGGDRCVGEAEASWREVRVDCRRDGVEVRLWGKNKEGLMWCRSGHGCGGGDGKGVAGWR